MKQLISIGALLGVFAFAGCGKDAEPPKPADTPAAAPAEPVAEPVEKPFELPVQEDFEEAAESEISDTNYLAELDALEKEIAADEAPTAPSQP